MKVTWYNKGSNIFLTSMFFIVLALMLAITNPVLNLGLEVSQVLGLAGILLLISSSILLLYRVEYEAKTPEKEHNKLVRWVSGYLPIALNGLIGLAFLGVFNFILFPPMDAPGPWGALAGLAIALRLINYFSIAIILNIILLGFNVWAERKVWMN